MAVFFFLLRYASVRSFRPARSVARAPLSAVRLHVPCPTPLFRTKVARLRTPLLSSRAGVARGMSSVSRGEGNVVGKPEKHTVSVEGGTLQVLRFCLPAVRQISATDPSVEHPVVFMVHGAFENGRIFHPRGRGLATHLASQGYDVFVGDLRGRGGSRPAIKAGDTHGQTENITEDIPAMVRFITELRGRHVPHHWVGHSWGGVLLSAYWARIGRLQSDHPEVLSGVYFGSKRSISVWNIQRLVGVEILWTWALPLVVKVFGYLPARALKIGSDNETTKFYEQSAGWVASTERWVDSDDNFNYGEALRDQKAGAQPLPPILYLTGVNDLILGNAVDVKALMDESTDRSSGAARHEFKLLGKKQGFRNDYDHIDVLTSADTFTDVFPLVTGWMDAARAR